MDAARGDQRQALGIVLDMAGQIGHEGVAADRQEEFRCAGFDGSTTWSSVGR